MNNNITGEIVLIHVASRSYGTNALGTASSVDGFAVSSETATVSVVASTPFSCRANICVHWVLMTILAS